MLGSLRRLLTAPVFEDEEKTAAAQLLFWLLITVSVIEVFTLIIILLVAPDRTFFISSALLINLFTMYFLRHGYVRSLSIVFVSLLWLILTVNGFTLNGIYTSSVAAHTVIIILGKSVV